MTFITESCTGYVITKPNPRNLFKVNPKPETNATKKSRQQETRPEFYTLQPEPEILKSKPKLEEN